MKQLSADDIFRKWNHLLEAGMVSGMGCSCFVTLEGSAPKTWEIKGAAIDLDNMALHSRASNDEIGQARNRCELSTSEDCFLSIAQGKLSPQVAFLHGQLKLAASHLSSALRLGPLIAELVEKSRV